MVRDARRASVLSASLAFAGICLCAGCSPPAQRSFYYWKSGSLPSAQERAFLDRLRVARLYFRIFDLGAEAEPRAPAPLDRGSGGILTGGGRRSVVPVVYVVPDALRGRSRDELRALGSRTAGEVLSRCRTAGIVPSEVQIDCDWTAGTRDGYFGLLAGVREGLKNAGHNVVLSATIRLHQVRDRASAGVPPADRGLLMAYNLEPPASPEVRNSILDSATLRPYLHGVKEYPLPLDVALPCFSWVVHFEGRRFLGLIPYAEAAAGLRDEGAFRPAGEGWLEAVARTYLAGRSVEPGDRVRVERVTPPAVLGAARALATRLPRATRAVAFFSLDAPSLEAFSGGSDETFVGIYSALGAGAAPGT